MLHDAAVVWYTITVPLLVETLAGPTRLLIMSRGLCFTSPLGKVVLMLIGNLGVHKEAEKHKEWAALHYAAPNRQNVIVSSLVAISESIRNLKLIKNGWNYTARHLTDTSI